MKVQLVVVRGKPEGKVIPLAGPKFKIGRGETCHLRPNSEQVSREHAEFTLEARRPDRSRPGQPQRHPRQRQGIDHRVVHPQGSRPRSGRTAHVRRLDPGCTRAPASRPAAAARPPAKPKPSPDDISTDDIDSWLLGENAANAADQPTAVYGGDTITIAAFKDSQARPSAAAKAAPAATPVPADKPPSVASDDEYERQSEEEEQAKKTDRS